MVNVACLVARRWRNWEPHRGGTESIQRWPTWTPAWPTPFGPSTNDDLVQEGQRYPPKAVVGLACR